MSLVTGLAIGLSLIGITVIGLATFAIYLLKREKQTRKDDNHPPDI